MLISQVGIFYKVVMSNFFIKRGNFFIKSSVFRKKKGVFVKFKEFYNFIKACLFGKLFVSCILALCPLGQN